MALRSGLAARGFADAVPPAVKGLEEEAMSSHPPDSSSLQRQAPVSTVALISAPNQPITQPLYSTSWRPSEASPCDKPIHLTGDGDGQEEKQASLPNIRRDPRIREVDELLLAIVLEEQPFAPNLPARLASLHAIARAMATAHKTSVWNHVDVTKRIAVLTTMLVDRPALLSSRLRNMVLIFNELNCKAGYAPRFRGELLGTLRKHATLSEASLPSRSARTVTQSDAFCCDLASEDIRLMTLVLKHRPFQSRYPNHGWTKVLFDLKHSSQDRWHRLSCVKCMAIHNEVVKSLSGRVSFLTTVFLDRNHPYHTRLSPRIRSAIVEFNLFNNGPDPDQSAVVEKRSAVQKSVSQAREYKLFMQIVLAVLPFHARHKSAPAAWDEVAQMFLVAGGTGIVNGKGALIRLSCLTKKMLGDSNPLNPELRSLVLRYHQLNFEAGGAGALDKPTIEKLRKHVVEAHPIRDFSNPREGSFPAIQAPDQDRDKANGEQRSVSTAQYFLDDVDVESFSHRYLPFTDTSDNQLDLAWMRRVDTLSDITTLTNSGADPGLRRFVDVDVIDLTIEPPTAAIIEKPETVGCKRASQQTLTPAPHTSTALQHSKRPRLEASDCAAQHDLPRHDPAKKLLHIELASTLSCTSSSDRGGVEKHDGSKVSSRALSKRESPLPELVVAVSHLEKEPDWNDLFGRWEEFLHAGGTW